MVEPIIFSSNAWLFLFLHIQDKCWSFSSSSKYTSLPGVRHVELFFIFHFSDKQWFKVFFINLCPPVYLLWWNFSLSLIPFLYLDFVIIYLCFMYSEMNLGVGEIFSTRLIMSLFSDHHFCNNAEASWFDVIPVIFASICLSNDIDSIKLPLDFMSSRVLFIFLICQVGYATVTSYVNKQ